MTREQRKQAIMRTREWFAMVIEQFEPLSSGNFDDLTEDQQSLVKVEKGRIAERIARTVDQ